MFPGCLGHTIPAQPLEFLDHLGGGARGCGVEGESVDDVAHTSEVVGFIATPCVKEEAETGKMAGEGFCCDADAVLKCGNLR